MCESVLANLAVFIIFIFVMMVGILSLLCLDEIVFEGVLLCRLRDKAKNWIKEDE